MSTGELRAVVEGRKATKLSEQARSALRVLLAERNGIGREERPPSPHPAGKSLVAAESYPADQRTKVDLLNGTAHYEIELARQRVRTPQRALEKFRFETKLTAVKNAGIAVAALVGLPLLALVLHLIDSAVKGDLFPGHLFALLFLVSAPFIFLAFVLVSVRVLTVGYSTAKRATPAEAVKTFLDAVELGLWQRAFNCLTDTAQNSGRVELPKLDYLQKKMPDIEIESSESLKNFWGRISFQWSPQWKAMKFFPLSDRAVRIILPLTITWSVTDGGKEKRREETVEAVFLAIEKGGHWFLANGFFWPEGRKYLHEKGVAVASAD